MFIRNELSFIFIAFNVDNCFTATIKDKFSRFFGLLDVKFGQVTLNRWNKNSEKGVARLPRLYSEAQGKKTMSNSKEVIVKHNYSTDKRATNLTAMRKDLN